MKKIRLVNTQLIWVEWEAEVELTETQYEAFKNKEDSNLQQNLWEVGVNVEYSEPKLLNICEDENEFKYEEVA